MSLRCPRCGETVPAAKVFWFIRLFSFTCAKCNARLALTRGGRTTLIAAVAASILLSYLVNISMKSEAAAVIVFFVGLLTGCVLTWRTGGLGVVEDAGG